MSQRTKRIMWTWTWIGFLSGLLSLLIACAILDIRIMAWATLPWVLVALLEAWHEVHHEAARTPTDSSGFVGLWPTEANPMTDSGEIGVAVECTMCGLRKKPVGRDAPVAMAGSLCDHECFGYSKDPHPGSLWPGETREEFGYDG